MMKAVEPVAQDVGYRSGVSNPTDTSGQTTGDQFPLLDMFPDSTSSASQLVLCALRPHVDQHAVRAGERAHQRQ